MAEDQSRLAENKDDQVGLKENYSKFLIEELPDEVLSTIVSFLSVKEAIRTSILSKRWKHAYLFMSRFDFDVDTFIYSDRRLRSCWWNDIQSAVDQFLNARRKIESFRLCLPWYFPFSPAISSELRKRAVPRSGEFALSIPDYYYYKYDDYYRKRDDDDDPDWFSDWLDYISPIFDHEDWYVGSDGWIRTAIELGAEELDLTYLDNFSYVNKKFSFEILLGLQQPSKLKHLRLQSCCIAPPEASVTNQPQLDDFVPYVTNQPILHSLATLELDDFVRVDEATLETIFSTCVNLWKLVLRTCIFDPNFTIAGPGINLKCLQIFTPIHLEKLQVSLPNLTYFEYHLEERQRVYPKTKLSFSNVLKLEEMHLDLDLQRYNRTVDDMFITGFATDAPKLKRLTSMHTILDINSEPQIPVSAAILCQLEQLELVFSSWKYCNLLKMIPMLLACPLLQKFHLTAFGRPSNVPYVTYSSKHSFPNLKQVKIRTFYGNCGNSFVFYLLENAVALERIILDTTSCGEFCKINHRFHEYCKLKHMSHEVPNQQIGAKVASPIAKLVFQHHPNDNTGFTKVFLR